MVESIKKLDLRRYAIAVNINYSIKTFNLMNYILFDIFYEEILTCKYIFKDSFINLQDYTSKQEWYTE